MTPANVVHKNLINGIWCDGDGHPNINPSNTQHIVGRYGQATAQQKQRLRLGRVQVFWNATLYCAKQPMRFWRAKMSWVACSAEKKARPFPRV
jgi:hypothetical protein